MFNSERFQCHKHCTVNRYVISIHFSLDVCNIRLVLFSKRDSWLAPLDKRLVVSGPRDHVLNSFCIGPAVGVTLVAEKEI